MTERLQLQHTAWSESVLYVSLHGELTRATAERFASELLSLRERGHGTLVLDLRFLARLTNSGGTQLVTEIRAVEDAQGRVTLIRPTAAVQETLDRLGVIPYLHVVQSPEEAREVLRV